jgi:DNA-binding CsgD family transcriptional regulator
MATARARGGCRERLEQLSESSVDCDAVRMEAIAELQRVIGFDRWCWPLADPETLLPCSGLAVHDYGPGVPRTLDLEYSSDGYAAKHVLVRRENAAGSLSTETHGDLARSQRWDQVMRHAGIGDVAAVACRDGLGCWGWIEAYRDRADRPFDEDDLALLSSAGPSLGAALRRSSHADAVAHTAGSRPPGVIVLNADLQAVSWTASARSWVADFPGAAVHAQLGILPSVIYPAAAIARTHEAPAGAHALLRMADDRWAAIEAARLEGRDDGHVAVTVRSATGAETFALLCRAYALSPREREVVAALVAGLDTRAITEQLFISPHTVQDHLKSVFRKVGVASRRELLARLRGDDA